MQKNLPDAHLEKSKNQSQSWGAPLAWVGMRNVQMPIKYKEWTLPALMDIGVDLIKSEARGIHMSRLYAFAQAGLAQRSLNFAELENLAKLSLESHAGLSQNFDLSLRFQLPVLQKSLVSENTGWRNYAVEFGLQKNSESLDSKFAATKFFLGAEIIYSSTCPASAALASEINIEAAEQKATPHAQRSLAKVRVQCKVSDQPEDLIRLIETALGTPVQSLVKRVDEREFAMLNASNLMFCEDAARRLSSALGAAYIAGSGQVDHFESLHAHDASARFSF
jgi:GTP cyclohydrolase IB